MMITTKLLSNSLVTFVRYFKNLSIGSATGIEPTTSHIAVQPPELMLLQLAGGKVELQFCNVCKIGLTHDTRQL